jgi:hypothetical protein
MRFADVSAVYAATAASLGARTGLEQVAVLDREGAALAAEVRALLAVVGLEAGGPIWRDLAQAAIAARWRVAVEPYGTDWRASGTALALQALIEEGRRTRPMLSATSVALVDALLSAASQLARRIGSPLGDAVLETLGEAGAGHSCVVVLRGRLVEAARAWLGSAGVVADCVTPARFLAGDFKEQAVLVGHPNLFGPGIFTAPRAGLLTYIHPSWLAYSVEPRSVLDDIAEERYRPRVKRFSSPSGEAAETVDSASRDTGLDPASLPPAPVWPLPATSGEAERTYRVIACRRAVLAGGYAVLLDVEGDRIRGLDPAKPAGARVIMLDSRAVGPGSILVLRAGETESAALRRRALERLGAQAREIERGQAAWKESLAGWVDRAGAAEVERRLRDAGVERYHRMLAWIVPNLVRPRSDSDFTILLRLLNLDPPTHLANATRLRRAILQSAMEVTTVLEDRLAEADLDVLEAEGHLEIALDLPGFAAMTAARVMAVSPHAERVPPADARVLIRDRSGQWLE